VELCFIGFLVFFAMLCAAAKMKFFMANNAKYKIFLVKSPL